MLALREVSKTYEQDAVVVHALAAVSLTVQAGEMVAVMGPSGSGKSTLLTIAGSLEEPTSGEVLVCGTDLATLPGNGKARLRRRVIGYVFQDFNLLPGLTAAENVSLPLELDGVAAGETVLQCFLDRQIRRRRAEAESLEREHRARHPAEGGGQRAEG